MGEFELKELINYLIFQHNRNTTKLNKINDAADLFQEAMLVIPIALKTWDNKKSAALKTHVINCIQNRFKDLASRDSRRQDLTGEWEFLSCVPVDPIEAFEFDRTMRAILEDQEFEIYRLHYVYGNTTREIRSTLQISSGRVQSCLQSICAKYQSLEKSLQKISTQRKLTANFLRTSEMSL